MKHKRHEDSGFAASGVICLAACCAVLLAGSCAFGADPTSWVEAADQLKSRPVTAEDANSLSEQEERDTRNKLAMRRIRPAAGVSDWNTDPTAIPFMLYQVKKRSGLDVYVDNDGLDVASDELFEHMVVYLTSHASWSFNEKETANLSKWLKRGGTLLLDDCYNKGSPFVDSVNPEVGKMVAGIEPYMLLKTDPRVKDAFKMIYAKVGWPGENIEMMRSWQYFLVDGRASIFFTPNDDGCGWEISTPPTASNPIGEGIGHGGDNKQRELFYKWATNWMMFVYTH